MTSKYISIIMVLLCLMYNDILSQTSQEFTYPVFEINLSPQAPGICPNKPTEVTCNEYYKSYKWEMLNPDPAFQTLYGQTVTLSFPGDYILIVEKEVNTVLCTEDFQFTVFDLRDPDDIEGYLLGNGFYSVPIIVDQSSVKQDTDGSVRQGCAVLPFKFDNQFDFLGGICQHLCRTNLARSKGWQI